MAAFSIFFLELKKSSFSVSKVGVLPTRLVETSEVAQLEVGVSHERFNKKVNGASRGIPKAEGRAHICPLRLLCVWSW